MTTTILHVHPDDDVRRSRGAALAAAGFRVVDAANGNEAIRVVPEDADLAVLPSTLPDMRAADLCRVLRGTRAGRPAVLVTGPRDETAWQVDVLQAGATVCLPDPADGTLLRAQVQALLDARRPLESPDVTRAAGESEDKYRRLFENMAEGFFLAEIIVDAAGRAVDYRYLDANPALESLTGLKRAALLGRTLREVLPGAEDRWLETYARVALTGEPARVEAFAGPLGRYYHTVAYSPRPGQFACVFSDVTERKRAEQALRDAEAAVQRDRAFLRTVIDSVASLVSVKDADGRYILANEATARFYGMTVGELEGKALEQLHSVPPDMRNQDLEVMRSGRETVFEMDAVAADGVLHSFINTKTPLFNDPGACDRVLTTAVDITWRKRAEHALKAAHARLEEQSAELRTILDALPAAVFITHDRDARVMEANRFAEEMLRVPRHSNVSKSAPAGEGPGTFRAVGDGAEIPADALPVQAAARTGQEVRDYEFDLVFEDTGTVSLLGNAVPLNDGHGQVRGAVGAFIDVTARRRAEKALTRANADLAEADQRKDEFIAVLSHELRNPLAPIRYALPVLQREGLGDPAARALAVIDRQVHHLTRLVDDLLDVSRITRGKIELRQEPVTLGTIVTAAVEAASPAIAAGRHSLNVTVADEPIWVQADPARIAQVVTNLLNNSAKYTPRGGRIAVDASCERGRAVVRVRDNGIGIPADALPTIFDMFRQVNRPDRSQGGLGIGLGLVKRLIELHGGTVEARSAGLGRGAEFLVHLPIAQEAKEDARPEAAAPSAAGRPLKVLIVDDNSDMVEMLADVVTALGHDVRKALDGRSAMSAAVSYRPDVVLLDLGLPMMSGLEVARELRRHSATANARLVALTGWGQAEDHKQTEEAGFDHHLTKPTEPQMLERLLAQFAADLTR